MQSQSSPSWHNQAIDPLLETLQTTRHGLSTREAQTRLEQWGANSLPEAPSPSLGQILIRQFRSPLIYVLALAATVSAFLGDLKDTGFIVAVLLINAIIGTYQEWRAEQSSLALHHLLTPMATILRDGEPQTLDATTLVPGDIVWLESGNRVPADLRLLQTYNLEMDESLLTGESLTVLKQAPWMGPVNTPLGDRLNMTYAGSMVVRGRGRGVVVATGTATTMGQLALDMMATIGGKPPLLKRMEQFSQVISLTVIGAAIAIALLGIFKHGYSLQDMFMFSIALAVSAIPEGLPVALTVTLAVGTHHMAQRGVIVRRLPAVEGLGSCTLIASDKTGTLTCNELTVRQIVLPDGSCLEVTGEGYDPQGEVVWDENIIPPDALSLDRLARVAALCNEADLHRTDYQSNPQSNPQWTWRGDPTDIALLSLAHKLGWHREQTLTQYPQINEIPFEPEHQFAATYHRHHQQIEIMVKGAPERVLPMCQHSSPSALIAIAQRMAAQGYRVLALASGSLSGPLATSQVPPAPQNLDLLGFVGMIDPLRPGVKTAIGACHAAGIAVWMVTGDHPATALAIAQDLGLAAQAHQVVTGPDLLERSPQEIQQLIATSCVFARITPHQKLELVNAARAAGHFVAVTGDGVNDAPALRAANIGVAMGKGGTDVAREAAELVISDDNFATLIAGVEEGRIAYDNIRKVIYLLVSTGAAELILLGLAVFTGLPLPLLPVQLLWLNLVTNGIQDVALAFEPGDGEVLSRRPRSSQEPIFNRLMIVRTLLAACVMGGVSFITFYWLIEQGQTVYSARNQLLLLLVLFEMIHLGNCRSERRSVLQLSPFRSPILLVGTGFAFLLHLLMMYLPLGQFLLNTEPVNWQSWSILLLFSLTVLVPIEIHKRSAQKLHNKG